MGILIYIILFIVGVICGFCVAALAQSAKKAEQIGENIMREKYDKNEY